MKINKNKFMIMLKDENVFERFLDSEGYLSNDVEDANLTLTLNEAERDLSTLNEPDKFMIVPVKVTYEFKLVN